MFAVTLNLLFPHSISRTESEFENSAMTSIKQEGLPLIDPSKIELRRETAVVLPGKRRGAHAALGYMCSAVLLVLFNKAALSSYSFPYVNVITLFQFSLVFEESYPISISEYKLDTDARHGYCREMKNQMLSSCAFLYAMKRWKIISFSEGEPQSVTSNPITLIPLRTLVHTLPLAVSYLLYMLITMESVRGINVPMYTTLRRTTVAFTMIVEYLLTGRKHSSYVVGRYGALLYAIRLTIQSCIVLKASACMCFWLMCVGIIILGAFVAGARDLSFDAYSYSIVFMANICSAVYLASIAHIGKSSGLNSFGLMWCNGKIKELIEFSYILIYIKNYN
ncbi:UDP-sugar transporter sqv-7-like [Gossypium australe]|uniref:UDP-sugar transporter sqv-7-like n=1 Tax=Gossypium australe TaxID=47621 RepID=A0A5B6XAP0_9ROSI|nr:UDP-sugar transporter sqv-7-like [Gossypium australe]